MYRIGEFSLMNKVTVKTLRYYDEIGLLKPAYVDQHNLYRYYLSEQIPVLHKLMSLRQIGFSIHEIQSMDQDNMTEIMNQKKIELIGMLKTTEERLKRLLLSLEELEGGVPLTYEVVVKEIPAVTVFCKRMNVADYDAYFQVIPKIGEEVRQTNPEVRCAVPEYAFIIYHDGEYRENNLDVEYCEAVDSMGKDTETIHFRQMDAIPKMACILHRGPYRTIGNAYDYLLNWIRSQGVQMTGKPRESYIDGIWNKQNEDEWLTELQIPIESN